MEGSSPRRDAAAQIAEVDDMINLMIPKESEDVSTFPSSAALLSINSITMMP